MVFFKRKKKVVDEQKERKPEVNKEQVAQEIETLLTQLENVQGTNRIDLLNKLGNLYFEISEFDHAIEYYETSILESKTLGKAYTDLIKLYNIKRKEATIEKNNEKVQMYLDKSDELMKLTKDTIRGRS